MSDELKPCPFCGEIEINTSSNGMDSEFAVCENCGAEGPSKGTRFDAIGAWNRRADQSKQGE
jgi:Lar family restriction alleviation protein